MKIQVSKTSLGHRIVLLITVLIFCLCTYSCVTTGNGNGTGTVTPNPGTGTVTPNPGTGTVTPNPDTGYAVTLHLIIAADTKDSKIGISVARDSRNMQNFFQEIVDSSNGEIFLNKIVLEGYSVTKNNLMRAVEYPKIKPNDIIIFTYSGHGHRDQWTQTRWPIMDTMEGNTDFSDIIRTIKSKNPRQFIVLADCCNKTTPARAEFRSEARGIFPYENIRKMFVTSNVQFAASGCEPEQFSYGNDSEGGFFTSAFISNLAQSLSSASEYTWDNIFYNVRRNVSQKTSGEQAPQYEKIR